MAGHRNEEEKNNKKIFMRVRNICEDISNSSTQTVLQWSKVKQDVRMLLATASTFLCGDGGDSA